MSKELYLELSDLNSTLHRRRIIELKIESYKGRHLPWLLDSSGQVRDLSDSDLTRYMAEGRCTKDVDTDEELVTDARVRDLALKANNIAVSTSRALHDAERKKSTLELSANAAKGRVDQVEKQIESAKAAQRATVQSAFDRKWEKENLAAVKPSYSIGSIIRWLLLGLLLFGPFASGFASVALQDAPEGIQLTIVGLAYAAGTLLPVFVYVLKAKKRAANSNSRIVEQRAEKERDEKQLAKDIEAAYAKVDGEFEGKLSSATSKYDGLQKEIIEQKAAIAKAHEMFAAMAKENTYTAVVKALSLKIPDEEASDEKTVLAVLEKGVEIAQHIYDAAYERFLIDVREEMLAAQQRDFESWRANEEYKQLQEEWAEANKAVTKASYLKSADAVLSESDMVNIDRIMEKVQTGRAATLSEALNSIDAEDRANAQHEQQMNAMEEHNRRMAEQRRQEAEERAQMEKAKLERAQIEAEQMKALKERELAMQEEHNAKMQAEERHRTEVRLQQEQERIRLQAERDAWEREAREKEVAAAEAAAFHQQERREIAAAEAAAAEAARQEEKKRGEARQRDNLSRCMTCRHNDNESVRLESVCYYAGMRCGDSDKCQRYSCI